MIGNGLSRLSIDLNQLKMTTYGCNALYRDYIPDYLISMDYSMVDEIIKNKIHYKTNFWTQHSNKIDELARNKEPINFFWGRKETIDSGNSALQLALKNQHTLVYVIGFDYSVSPAVLPNVYAGTPNYTRSNIYPAASMNETKWINRLNRILKEHPDQKVIRVTDNKHINVTLPNYSEITIEQFKEILNGIHI